MAHDAFETDWPGEAMEREKWREEAFAQQWNKKRVNRLLFYFLFLVIYVPMLGKGLLKKNIYKYISRDKYVNKKNKLNKVLYYEKYTKGGTKV